jgi:hypothetical protein
MLCGKNVVAGARQRLAAEPAMERKTRADDPATIALAGTPQVTTLPAPTGAFSPIVTLTKMVAPEPIDAPALTSVGWDCPVLVSLELAIWGGGAGGGVVDGRDAVTDEHVVLDRDAFADEGVARDLAVAAAPRPSFTSAATDW